MGSWSERVRGVLAEQILPVIRREGVRRVFVPEAMGGCRRLSDPSSYAQYRHLPHAGPELICFVGSVSPVWVGSHLYGPSEGDVLLMPPGAEHAPAADVMRRLETPAGPGAAVQVPLTFFPFGATGGFAQTVGCSLYSAPGTFFEERHLLPTADALVRELVERRPGFEVVAQGLLLEILGRVLRAPTLPVGEAARAPEPALPAEPVPDLVARAREYLHRHYDQPVTLPEVARYLGASPSHLSHVFKSVTGQTIVGYLTGVRVAAAQRLLRTPLPIARVAELVGIPDPYYFSRVFRRATGVSPTQARAGAPLPDRMGPSGTPD